MAPEDCVAYVRATLRDHSERVLGRPYLVYLTLFLRTAGFAIVCAVALTLPNASQGIIIALLYTGFLVLGELRRFRSEAGEQAAALHAMTEWYLEVQRQHSDQIGETLCSLEQARRRDVSPSAF